MDNIKTSVVNCIRRLMEKLPMREPIERCTSETEIWSAYVDPVLDSLLSSPEEGVHLRWTNKKDIQEVGERPDSIVSIMSQSQWSRNFGHGEAKIAEATENYHVLAWDLCRLGYFNKNIINKDNVKSSFAFQSKGHSVTFYISELAFDGVYVMTELNSIQIPKSVNTLETLITRRSLMCLMQVAHVFDKIKKEKKNTLQEFSSMKRVEPSLKQLESLVSEKKDRRRNSSVRF
ncbi:hypothetical protein G6F57_007367 [Rhizopus arrhizus]|uniref:Uncharacterized protein n=1 Tax=Rhizopus oryzae TaxID=64495 RepID=A0A9P6XAM0_RHIOR|nr:hypothetical protein G6F23_006096 [Rhizopus arrhizus]KAG1413266.1 hypothetical protein G6F58_007587 [Rhizopus delemar]KAG0942563.1 hypothetical protein G6F30_005681 [Rhizopus arrhizus]KAG0984000.1 hypothetical protein G6F29_005091 [Rhizopus arrhizus]KAG0995377.1 hypothetical protein G6F28_004853 [Rhizopus arrhizus]